VKDEPQGILCEGLFSSGKKLSFNGSWGIMEKRVSGAQIKKYN
jgi:hypothetical protein